MTDRERWTIYPLLTLALGLSLHDKLFPTRYLEALRVTCRELVVEGPDGTRAVQATSDNTGGGHIVAYSAQKKPNVMIDAYEGGGSVRLADDNGHITADLGHDGEGNGHLVLLGQGNELVALGDDEHKSGKAVVFGPDKHACVALTVDPDNGCGQVRTFNLEGVAQVILDSIQGGGQVVTASGKKPLVAIRHDGAGTGGIVTFDARGAGHAVPVARTAIPMRPAGQDPTQEETSDPSAPNAGSDSDKPESDSQSSEPESDPDGEDSPDE